MSDCRDRERIGWLLIGLSMVLAALAIGIGLTLS